MITLMMIKIDDEFGAWIVMMDVKMMRPITKKSRKSFGSVREQTYDFASERKTGASHQAQL
jgi:hypothetical protein